MGHPIPGKLLYGGDYNPEQWSEETWLDDMRLMKLAHVNIVSINIFSWALLEPRPEHYTFQQLDRIMHMLHEHGIAADLATATASPPPWMSQLYPSMLPVTREGLRMSHGSRQHYCPNSPDYRRKAAQLVQNLAERYKNHPTLRMWHINNEYACHTQHCYCDTCAEAFRAWLQNKYASLEVLNETWGTVFWSQHYTNWEEILPPRITPAQNNPTQQLDYWRFMSDAWLECYRLEETILRSTTPEIPLTTNLMTSFKPVDAFAWAPYMDIVSFDIYPTPETPVWENAFHQDLMRSLRNGQPHLVMEQSPGQVNWQGQNPQKRPGAMRLQAFQAIAHGADGNLFFQWRQSKSGAEMYHSAVVTHEGNEHNRIFQQVARVGADLEKISATIIGSRMPHAQVAFICDWDNWWSVEYEPGPSNLVRYMDQLKQYYHAFQSQNIAIDFVSPGGDLNRYSIIVAPLFHLLHRGDASRLEEFVSLGGTLLTSFFSGIVNEKNHVTLGGYPGELRKLLGIHVEEFDPWRPGMANTVEIEAGPLAGSYPAELWGEFIHLEGAVAIGTFGSDYYAQCPAITVNRYGQGKAYYIATRIREEILKQIAQSLCEEKHITAPLTATETIEITMRVNDQGQEIYFLLNHNQESVSLHLPGGAYQSLLNDQLISDSITIPPGDVVILQKHV